MNGNLKLERAAARSGEWAQHFSNVSCLQSSLSTYDRCDTRIVQHYSSQIEEARQRDTVRHAGQPLNAYRSLPWKYKTQTFSQIPLVLLARIRDHRLLRSGRLLLSLAFRYIAKTHTCTDQSCHVPIFILYVALCGHNLPTRRAMLYSRMSRAKNCTAVISLQDLRISPRLGCHPTTGTI